MTTKDTAASAQRSAMSDAGRATKRPNMATVTPDVAISTSTVATTCAQPGLITISERAKIAKVMKVIGAQILSASYMVRRNDALAMRADTAAVSEVGGESSPQTESRNTKKWATQGLMPSSCSGRTITTAPMMYVAVGGSPAPASQPKIQ